MGQWTARYQPFDRYDGGPFAQGRTHHGQDVRVARCSPLLRMGDQTGTYVGQGVDA